jgi:thioredoxin reductase (NADPH)
MESLAGDLSEMKRTPLLDEHVAAMCKIGREREYPAGEIVTEVGRPVERFIYVLEGEAEALDPTTREPFLPHTIGPTQFLGDIAFLSGGVYPFPMRAVTKLRTLEVEREAMLELMRATPEMSDIVIAVLAARLRRQFEEEDSALILIGNDDDRATRAVATFASRNRIPMQYLDPASREAATAATAAGLESGRPAVIFAKQEIVDPTPRKLAQRLGMDLPLEPGETIDVLIVGGGPAGVAAAVYAGSEGLKALLVDDLSIGGQAGWSSRIENYMGFPTGISGVDLVWRGQIQAMKFGSRFAVPCPVDKIAQSADGVFHISVEGEDEIRARSVVVATGVQYQRLPLAKLELLEGTGVYYAATDMEARFCSKTEVAIIGGGNSAGQAAMYLSRHASHVHVLVRSKSLASSMSEYLSSRLKANPAVTIHYTCEVSELHGDTHLEAITLKTADGDEKLPVRALFVMVGAAPNTAWLGDCVKLDAKGFVLTGDAAGAGSPHATSQAGVFAVGDVRAGSVKRVASAVGEGSVAISQVWNYLNERQDKREAAAAD